MLDRQRTSSIGSIVDNNSEGQWDQILCLARHQDDVVGKITVISNTLLSMVKKVTDPRNNISVDTHFISINTVLFTRSKAFEKSVKPQYQHCDFLQHRHGESEVD